jgi:outer membrane protein TolC
MKRKIALSLLAFSLLHAKHVELVEVDDKKYSVYIGSYASLEQAKENIGLYPDHDIFIKEELGYQVAYMVNIESVAEQKQMLTQVKQLSTTAKLWRKRFHPKPKKTKEQQEKDAQDKVIETLEKGLSLSGFEEMLMGIDGNDTYDLKSIDTIFDEVVESSLDLEQFQEGVDDTEYVAHIDETKDPFYMKKFGLREAIDKMIHYNDLIKGSVENVEQTKIEHEKAWAGGYLPKVTTDATRGVKRIDEGSGRGKAGTRGYSLNINQNVFKGFATHYTVEEKRYRIISEKFKHKNIVEVEINKAIKAYMDLVYNEASLEVNQKNMESMEEIMDIVQVKFDNGSSTEGDLNAIKASLSNAKTALIKTESAYTDARAYFEYIIGKLGKNIQVFEQDFNFKLPALSDVLKEAIKNNTQILANIEVIKANRMKLKQQYASYYPKVDMKLGYTDTKSWGNSQSINEDAKAEVKISYDLFDGMKPEYERVKIRSDIAELQYKVKDSIKKLKWDLTKLHKSISSSSSAMFNVKVEISASEKVVEAYWNEFKLGSQDLQELLDAHKKLNSAELALIKYKKARILDYFKLLEKSGTLLDYFNIAFHTKFGEK